MKKIICLISAVVVAAVLLTACDSGNSKKTETQTEAQTTAQQGSETPTIGPAADRYTLVYKGTNIMMKAEAAAICEALGECKSYNEETSCAFDGLDKSYTYTSFILTTYPDGDIDRINSVTLLDDTVSTVDGISIGDTKEKVESVYGADSFNGVNAYIMTEGQAQLAILIDTTTEKVNSIQYTALFE